MALPEIFAQEGALMRVALPAHEYSPGNCMEKFAPGSMAQGLNQFDNARASRTPHNARRRNVYKFQIRALQFFASKPSKDRVVITEIQMPCDIRPFKTGKRTHPDIVELREQERTYQRNVGHRL